MTPRRLSLSLNPLWTHYVSIASLVIALVLGLARYLAIDRADPLHCDALLTEGQWLDDKFRNWQPEGCMMYTYTPKDVQTCIPNRRVVFVGDSVTRQLFFQFAHIIDPTLPIAPPGDEQKHADYSYASSAVHLSFVWDPYLNSSHVQSIIGAVPSGPSLPSLAEPSEHDRPALLVLGTGLWYLRYAESGGLPAWESKMESTFAALTRAYTAPADSIVLLPVSDVVPAKLSHERAETMRGADIDAMNSDLKHRVHPPPPSAGGFSLLPVPRARRSGRPPVALPLVFNAMLHPGQTEDGLHFSGAVVGAQAQVLLNLVCNDVMPKTFPMDRTCCRKYPLPSPLHSLVLAVAVLWGPACVLLSRRLGPRPNGQPFIGEQEMPAVVLSVAAALIYLADRTGFWLKEQKQFSPWVFSFLSFISLAMGLCTMQQADKDLGFLNREQTDEWKGWMQVAILIYHYTGASKISGIYNVIRVLVASYLFMTGYGHTTFYIKKADFGFLRIAQVMVRLNLLTLLLAYTMNTDYLFYYFAPLVSWWFLIIYGTMFVGSQYNDRTIFVLAKILLSMGLVTWLISETWILESLFDFLKRVCGIHWSAREWAFRVGLDLWIVYFGMLVALAVIKMREHRLTDHPQWPLAVKASVGLSGVVLLWFFAFELYQPDKFAYNLWHPYVSFLPVGAFIVLRNANVILRSASSRAFAFIGTCSLETFIIQYHFWLAGDTKGILLVIPGTRWRSVNIILTSVVFVYVSHRVAQATGEITNWVCGTTKQTLPTTAEQPSGAGRRSHLPTPANHGETIFLVQQNAESMKDEGDDSASEPDSSIRSQRRWVDRLAEGTSSSHSSPGFRVWYGETEWKPGVKTKLGIAAAAMWLVNIMWPYP